MFTKTLALALVAALASAAPTSSGNTAITGPGILMDNQGTKATEYCFFNNIWNGNGVGVPKFDNPDKCITLSPGSSQFIPLEASFKGRVQRGKILPATWVEFQLSSSDDHQAHGDISLEQGMDGCATISSTDGTSPVVGGFTKDLVAIAPAAATTMRQDGQKVIASTAGNWMAGPNQEAVKFLSSQIDSSKAYILGGTGVQDVASKNQALNVTFC
jgi:hypothetical protein